VLAEDGWTYSRAGVIDAVSPAVGSGGTQVDIYGAGLRGSGEHVVSVTLSGIDAEISSEEDYHVVVVAGATDAGDAGSVTLTADSGAIVTKETAWTYVAEVTIADVSPRVGTVGTLVTITGENFNIGSTEVSEAYLGPVEATILSQDDTTVNVRANYGSSSEAAVRLISSTGVTTSSLVDWTYLSNVDIHAVTPSSGHEGTKVEIVGVNLFAGGSELVQVTLAGIDATIVTQAVDTVTLVATASEANVGDVVLQSESGAAVTRRNGWEYVEIAEIASTPSPSSGQAGTSIAIGGSGLLMGGSLIASVTLAGIEVKEIVSAADNEVVVIAAAHTDEEEGVIVLIADTGAITTGGTFSYLAPGAIGAPSPDAGQYGTQVTFEGSGMLQGGESFETVSLNNVDAEIVSGTDTKIVVTANIGEVGVGDVVVVTDSGATLSLEDGWTYNEDGVIEAVEPTSGQTGTVITISGSRLLGGGASASSVSIVGTDADVLTAAADSIVVSAASPSELGSGSIVIVADTGATVTLDDAFEYLAGGVLDSVTPGNGQVGTKVVLEGTSLLSHGTNVQSVTLAGAAADIQSENDSVIEVVAAASDELIGDVVIIADTGAATSKSDAWTYEAPGAVTSVEPASGQYGTAVVISGSGLRGGGDNIVSVTLGDVEAANIVSEGDDTVAVVAPHASPAEDVDIVLTADSGAVVTAAGVWEFLERGTIDDVSPAEGQTGTTVVLTGSKMIGDGTELLSVTLAGEAAAVEASTASEITLTAASGAAGAGDVVVTSVSGAVVTKSGAFTYIEEGAISLVTPARGQRGTYVKIFGSNLLGGGSTLLEITLSGVAPSEITNATNDEIWIRAASATDLGPGDIEIISDTGATVLGDNEWTYDKPSNITKVCS
jgi:hypothetical protein